MDYVAKAVGMVKGRIEFVQDLWAQGDFFFLAPTAYAEKDVKKDGRRIPRLSWKSFAV